MEEYWCKMGDTINSIIDAKVKGWDQIRIHFEVTSKPIYNFSVVGKDGSKRDFGIYGYAFTAPNDVSNYWLRPRAPTTGAKLEDGSIIPQMYVDLYDFARKQ